MVKKKKEESGFSSTDFSEHINELQNKLKIASICNELIKAENPFSVKIDDSDFLFELSSELNKILSKKINNTNDDCVDNHLSSAIQFQPQFSNEEVFILKQIITRMGQKKEVDASDKRPLVASPVISTKNSNKEVYFDDGEMLMLSGNTVFMKEDGERDILQAGSEVSFVRDFGGGKISVIDLNSGEEGIIEASRAKKQL